MISANPKLQDLTDYPFDRLRALLDPLDPPKDAAPLMLSLGEPQHSPPALITEILSQHHDHWRRYPPVDGTDDWRDAVFNWLSRRFNLGDEILGSGLGLLPASGTREILFMVAQALLPPSKNGKAPLVLMPNPFYQVYLGACVMNGATPVFMDATPENGFMPRLKDQPENILRQTSMVYLCSPANPQGAAADLDYWIEALELARRFDFVLCADECYTELYYKSPPAGALEAAKALGKGYDNLLVFHSLSKRSNAAGLRSGFVAGDPALIKPLRHLRSYSAASVPIPIMKASAALWAEPHHVAENRALYLAKFKAAESILDGRFSFEMPDGGFFLWLDVGNGEEATRALWQEAGLRVLPGAYLARDNAAGGNPGAAYIRVALVHDLETSKKALRALVKVL